MAFSRLRREAEKEQKKRTQQTDRGQVATPVSPGSRLVQEAAKERGTDSDTLLKSRITRNTIGQTTNTTPWIEERAREYAAKLGTKTETKIPSASELKGGNRTGAETRNSIRDIEAVQPKDFDGGVRRYSNSEIPKDYNSIVSELEKAKGEYKKAFQDLTEYETSHGVSGDYTASEYYSALSRELGRASTRLADLEKAKKTAEAAEKAKAQAGDVSEFLSMTDDELNARIAAVKKEMDSATNVGGFFDNDVDSYISNSEKWRGASSELAELQKEMERRQKLQGYETKTHEDNFFGQFGANFDVGNLNELVNKAYSDYLWNPTPENKAYADQLATTLKRYQENNAEALDEEGSVLSWISKSAAGYLPQLGHQLEAGIGGAALGGAAGAGVGSLLPGIGTASGGVWGARAGYVGGTGAYSFNNMRGAAFKQLLEMGVDEETARAAATDEGVISALIEMVDAGIDLATLGTAKIASTPLRKVAKALLGYGINIGTEGLEESAQQAVSIANRDRVASGEYDPNNGLWGRLTGLGFDSAGTAVDALTGKNPEARKEIAEAGIEGMKIAAMFGGTGMAVNSTINTMSANSTGKNIQSSGDVDILVDIGRSADPKTESYKIATDILKKQNTGKEIINTEVGWLYQAIRDENILEKRDAAERVQTEEEAAREAVSDWGGDDPVMRLAQEAVAERERAAEDAPVTLEELARETVAERERSQQAQPDVARMTEQTAESQQAAIKKWTGYGDNGVKAFTEALEQSDADPAAVRKGFQTAYESGLAGIERKSVELITPLQEQAYIAGRLDYVAAQEKNAVNTTVIHRGGILNIKDAPKDISREELAWADKFLQAMGTEGSIGITQGNANITGSGKLTIAPDFGISDTLLRELGSMDHIEKVAKLAHTRNMTLTEVLSHEAGIHRAMQLAPAETLAFINKMYEHLGKDVPASVATLAERRQAAYGSQNVDLTTVKAIEEVVADAVIYLYGNQGYRDMVNRIMDGTDQQAKRGLQKFVEAVGEIIERFKKFLEKLTGKEKTEAKKVLDDLQELRDMYEGALKAAMDRVKAERSQTAQKNTAQMDGDSQFSVKTVNGKQVVWIENSTLTNKQLQSHTAVAEYIAQHIGEVYTIIESGQKVYIGEDLPGEYTQSKYTDAIKKSPLLRAKNKAVNELGLLIETATNRRWEKTKHTHNKDAKYGMYRYDSSFAFPAKDRDGNVTNVYAYDAELLIRNASDGKKYLYDIVSIKENTTSALDLQQRETRAAAHKAATRGDVSADSVAQQEDVVNGGVQHSLKDSDYLAAVKSGDMETAQRMVDEAAKAAGYTVAVFHGTDKEFTKFKHGELGIHVGTRGQAEARNDKRVISLYANLGDSFDIYRDYGDWHGKNTAEMLLETEEVEALARYDDTKYAEIESKLKEIAAMPDDENTDTVLREYLQSLGWDSITYENRFEDASDWEVENWSHIVFDPENIKSADPVTYDDNGEVIPLSQRFNPENEDIRFSLKDSETKSLTDVGVSYDRKTETVNPSQFSLKTWTQSSYVTAREKAAKEMAKALGITEKKALAYIDSVNSIAKMIADDRVRLDYEASPGRSSFVKNAEYGGSIDFSTICKKRRLFTGTFEAIQEALPNTTLTAEEILDIRSRMDKKGYEVSCGLCYVEGSRANMGQFTKQFLERYKATNPKYVPNMAEMNTATGQEKIRREHPEVYEAYEYFMNHYGRLDPSDKALFASQQKPKMYQMSTEYQGEILQKFKKGSNVEDKNANGGLRLQSFSDFEIIHLIDTMQVIMDMAHVGLAGQAYTKVPDFAWALGDTRLKINLSLIAKGIDRNGKLILDEKEGMSEANAMALRDRYSENVGTILVVFTDNQLKAAMADSRIDFIIPFHRSQWKTDQYEIMGLPANAKDYTNWQNEAYIEPVYNAKGKKQRPDNYMPNTYWDFSKSGKENAETYLRMCAENNRRPKFHFLLKDNKNGSYSLQPDGSTDGYWKLLIDFKMYDNDGNGVPQRPVRPDFNMEEAQRMLEDYTGGHSKFPVAEDVVAEFVEEYKSSHEGVEFSLKEHNDLIKENAKLKEVNEALREQFKTTTFAQVDKKSLDKFTKQLLKDYQSGADINEIRDALNDVYTYMANGEDGQSAAWNDLQERAYNVAVSILENASTVNDDMYQAYKSLRDRLRNYPISIRPEYNKDIQGYESINEFRKANFGKLKIANDGTPVDIVYSDLANTYPEFFDESEYTTQADQITHIADVLDSLQPYEVNPYSSDMRSAATWLASDIIERFYELPQAKSTFADKQAAKLTKQVIKDAKKLENLREKKNERIKDLIQKNREKVKATTQKERQKRVEAVKEVKAHYKAKEKKASESRKARELRAKIMRHAQEMSRKLLRPTDKQHIPQKLQGAVAKLLEAINLESNYTYDPNSQSYKKSDDGLPSARTKAFAELRKLYSEMANELVIDPDLLGEDGLLSDVAALADKRVADMTSEELETVYRTLRAVEATVSSANKAFAESRWASIEEAAESIREENKDKRQITEYSGAIGWGQKLTGLDMMTPSAFFHRLGESGDAIFRMMRNAQDKHIALMKAVEDFTHKELNGIPVNKWEREIHTVKLGGEDVQLTTAQIMELYVLTKRKQAQDHIFMGGILPETVANKGIKKISRAEPVRGIQIGEVSAAVNLLTEEQKKVADKLQEYASTELSGWGNEAAMQVYNYEKFNEAVYWPIRSNRQEIASTVEKDTQVTSVAGRGFSKNTKPNANTSVKVGSIFDTFAAHSSEMATYAAWLAPAEDINRIRNYTFLNEDGGRAGTVKGIIERVHGSRGTQYLQKLLSDIANGVGAGRGNETRMDKIVGNYKASAIGANLRVIIQQPTSLLRSLDMIDAKYIASNKSPMSGWKKAKKYAPIAQWKDWGYFDINTGRQMKDVLFETDTKLDKVKQFTMAGAGLADSISWGTLWNAVENEVRATRKNLKPGTEEFYKAVGARFTEIVDHTQVVDGILQRSQIMRSADGLTKMATSFMGEPTKQYNMVMSALYDFRHTEGKERTYARKRFGRTVTALVISGAVNAAAQSIIDAVRDDDDEKEYWEKWLSAFFGLDGDEETLGETTKAILFGSNLMNIFNPAGYIPYAKDVVSLLQGYDVSRMDMESIEKTISSWNNLWKAINGEGNYTIQGAAINFIGEAARLFGVPAANLKREIVSFATMVAQETDNLLMQYRMEKFFTNVQNSGGSALDILFNAYQNDSEAYALIYKDMLASGFDPEKLKSGMETRMKKAAGVTKTSELDSRYMHPNQQAEYDSKMKTIQRSNVWKNANEEQRGKLEDNLYNIVSGTGTGENLMETISEGAPFGLDETEYLLYKLALETVDQPNESGNYGSYTTEEKARAFASMNLGDGEMAFLWGTDQALEAYAYGVDMQKYITFKAAVGSIKADKDRRGNSISGSKEKKIKAYLRSLGVSNLEYWYLLGTEYDLKDNPNYRRYFG